jgi:hypothetical protein
LGNLYQSLQEYNKETGPYLVNTLSRLIENAMEEKKGQPEPKEALLVKCYQTMLDWYLVENDRP